MVLNDANNANGPASATPPPPPSSIDHSPSRWPITRPNGLQPLYLDLSKHPRPWLDTEALNATRVRKTGQFVQQWSDKSVRYVGRPYKQEEADAVAFHIAKGYAISHYHAPAGLAVALALSLRGRRQFRFPFYTPKWTYCSPHRFLFLRDRVARAHWHALRGAAYLATGGLVTSALISGYGGAVSGIGRAQDPRMKDITSLMRQNAHIWIPLEKEEISKYGRTVESSKDESSELARQQVLAPREVNVGEDKSDGHAMDESVTGSVAADYQDQYQQTDKTALLEAIRRADGKSAARDDVDDLPHKSSSSPSAPTASSPTTPEPPSDQSAWDQLRDEAGQQPLATSPGPSHGEETTGHSDHVSGGKSQTGTG